VAGSRCSAAKLSCNLRFFFVLGGSGVVSLLGLLSLSPVPTRLDSTWWLVLGRTKGYLGDMRGSENF
jgi:hypothetical protein